MCPVESLGPCPLDVAAVVASAPKARFLSFKMLPAVLELDREDVPIRLPLEGRTDLILQVAHALKLGSSLTTELLKLAPHASHLILGEERTGPRCRFRLYLEHCEGLPRAQEENQLRTVIVGYKWDPRSPEDVTRSEYRDLNPLNDEHVRPLIIARMETVGWPAGSFDPLLERATPPAGKPEQVLEVSEMGTVRRSLDISVSHARLDVGSLLALLEGPLARLGHRPETVAAAITDRALDRADRVAFGIDRTGCPYVTCYHRSFGRT